MSIRNLIKNGDHFEITATLATTLIGLANIYTGVVIDTEIDNEGDRVPSEAALDEYQVYSGFVIEMFPMLSFHEVQLAFKMAAAKKLKGISLKTYFGKFHADMLGDILSAYLDFRKGVIFDYDKTLSLEQSRKPKISKEEIERLNKIARSEVIEEYEKLKQKFEKEKYKINLDDDIKTSWAKTLNDCGYIKFKIEEKREILKEARQKVLEDFKKSLVDSKKTSHQLQNIKTVIKKINQGEENESFELKVINKYSKLLIFKSIIQS